MVLLDSLTEGCKLFRPGDFDFEPDEDEAIGMNSDGLYPLPGEVAANVSTRLAKYHQRWMQVDDHIQQVILTMNQQALARIVQFVSSTHLQPLQQRRSTLKTPSRELPTGLVFSGINIPDHGTLIDSLADQIRQASARVAVMWSRNCSTLKATLKSIIQKLSGEDQDIPQEEDDEEQNEDVIEVSITARRRVLPLDDMRRLTGWYDYMKEKQPLSRPKQLVLLLPDMECFDPQILADLVFICSAYVDRLPFVFLIGIATSLDGLHQILPTSAISLLSTETFKLQLAEDCLDRIVDEIFMKSPTGLKLGGPLYEYLLAKFGHYDLSVREFVRGIQYAHMKHYYSEPLSILTDLTYDSEDHKYILDSLQRMHYDRIRSLKSFQNYLHEMLDEDPERAEILLSDDGAIQRELEILLRGLQHYHSRYLAAVECISSFQTVIKTDHKFSRRQSYDMGLKCHLGEVADVKAVMESIKTLAFTDVKALLSMCVDAMDTTVFTTDVTLPEATQLKCFLDVLDQFKADPAASLAHGTRNMSKLCRFSTSISSTSSKSSAASGSIIVGNNTSYISQQAIKRVITASASARKALSSTKLKQTDYNPTEKPEAEEGTWEAFLRDVYQFFKHFFKDALKPYTSVALHEIMYISSRKGQGRAFNPEVGAAVKGSLTVSRKYLNCDCCSEIDPREPHPTLEDTQIAYRLYLECGKLINLYDWYVAFRTILEQDQEWLNSVGGTENGTLGQQEVHARFVRAVGELQLMGFIKQTGRKKDHVSRLTW
ncbi:hypothetical protein SeMB42_g03233 [Synchytrium endobioticum]|uniref:Origin recognition complex subunit 3 n=1 Tax=Synchytrium endobioticum TaxID=286115 RepID=A0A507D8M1_9FUNG|nr:hypothetical protein SeLEV6574_g06234 [Synchytrium endobioticum]TPX47687.1 hypothetical protein SeMB42_g03233 [Synchytrium endobioticum]